MPAVEPVQSDMFAAAVPPPVQAEPLPQSAAPAIHPDRSPDWQKLREELDQAKAAALIALDGIRDQDDIIRRANAAIDLRKQMGSTPVPQPWLDKLGDLNGQRRDIIRSAINRAFIPYLHAEISLKLAVEAFLRAAPAVRLAPTKTGGKELPITSNEAVIMDALVRVFNATAPSFMFHEIPGSSAQSTIPLEEFEHIDWSSEESRESYKRLEAAQIEPVDVPDLIAAATEYLTISLRLMWAHRPKA